MRRRTVAVDASLLASPSAEEPKTIPCNMQAIIFDMDGLMVNTEPLYWEVARQLAARHASHVTDETLRRMMGRSRHESMRIFIESCGIIDVAADALLAMREEMMIQRFRSDIQPMAYLPEILKQFHGRLKLGIATSSPRKFVDVLLPALGVEHYFQAVQTGDDITEGKPHPEIYHKAMARLQVQPAEVIVLEDSQAGAQSGKLSGAYVIAVPSILTAEEDFSFVDYRAEDLADAARRIETLLQT
jgi:HAD superfamily hydrolase (TIGR01509 family)